MLLGMIAGDAEAARLVNDMLVRIHGFRSINMQDRIRLSLLRLNPYVATAGMQLSDLIAKFGWQQSLKQFDELRDLLLRMENDCTRNCWGYSFWLRISLDYVITQDMEVGKRDWLIWPITHIEEYNEIQDCSGTVIKVTRSKLCKTAFIEEMEPQIWDYKLNYSGSKEALYSNLLEVINACKLAENGES